MTKRTPPSPNGPVVPRERGGDGPSLANPVGPEGWGSARRLEWTLLLVWTLVIVASMALLLWQERREYLGDARAMARAIVDMDLLLKRWVDGHDALFVRHRGKASELVPVDSEAVLRDLARMSGQLMPYRIELRAPSSLNTENWQRVGTIREDLRRVYDSKRAVLRYAVPLEAPGTTQDGAKEGKLLVLELPLHTVATRSDFSLTVMGGLHALIWALVVVSVVAGFRRIREEWNAREELRRQNAEYADRIRHLHMVNSLCAMAGGMAHDFNNVLTLILGHAQTIRQAEGAEGAHGESLDGIVASTRRAALLTTQMLACAGGGTSPLAPIDLREVVENLRSLLDAITGPEIRVLVTCPDTLPLIRGDRGQIRQALIDLVNNAAEAILEGGGGKVFITLSEGLLDEEFLGRSFVDDDLAGGRYVCITVRDDGPGIPPERLEQAFLPFISTRGEARGLGLPAVLGIVRKHGGAVDVRGEKPDGRGFRIDLYLPVLDEVEGIEPAPAADAATGPPPAPASAAAPRPDLPSSERERQGGDASPHGASRRAGRRGAASSPGASSSTRASSSSRPRTRTRPSPSSMSGARTWTPSCWI